MLSDPAVWSNLLIEPERSPANLEYYIAPIGAISYLAVANLFPIISDILLMPAGSRGEIKLVMTFKRRRPANIAMLANTAIACECCYAIKYRYADVPDQL